MSLRDETSFASVAVECSVTPAASIRHGDHPSIENRLPFSACSFTACVTNFGSEKVTKAQRRLLGKIGLIDAQGSIDLKQLNNDSVLRSSRTGAIKS